MTYVANVDLRVDIEASFEISDEQLDVMKAHGVDVVDQHAVGDFYRSHLDDTIDGVWFLDAHSIIDRHEHTREKPDVDDFWVEGDPPDRFYDNEAVDR